MNCITVELEAALNSREDGVLARFIGEYAMEPFIQNMNPTELLVIFAPNVLHRITQRNDYILEYASLNDLFDDIEVYRDLHRCYN
jgi:hypothetical protein